MQKIKSIISSIKKPLTSILLISSISSGWATCTVEVNSDRTFDVTGGKYVPCDPADGKTCEINILSENADGDSATRHHILNKQAWVDVLNKSLSDETAKKNIIRMLETVNAPKDVIENLEGNGTCASSTNSWLTWLPVNIVLGPAPQERSWDPSDSYDQWAVTFIPNEYQQSFNSLGDSNISDQDAAKIIATLPTRADPWLANEEDSTTNVEWIRAKDDSGELKYCTNETAENNSGKCPNHA